MTSWLPIYFRPQTLCLKYRGPAIIPEGELQRVQDHYTYLSLLPEGSKVVVVEEFSNTGATVQLALYLLHRLFPKLVFEPFIVSDNQGKLFHGERGYNPSWRIDSRHDTGQGQAGVVDPEIGRLTAESAYVPFVSRIKEYVERSAISIGQTEEDCTTCAENISTMTEEYLQKADHGNEALSLRQYLSSGILPHLLKVRKDIEPLISSFREWTENDFKGEIPKLSGEMMTLEYETRIFPNWFIDIIDGFNNIPIKEPSFEDFKNRVLEEVFSVITTSSAYRYILKAIRLTGEWRTMKSKVVSREELHQRVSQLRKEMH